jgi:hypothetical protein
MVTLPFSLIQFTQHIYHTLIYTTQSAYSHTCWRASNPPQSYSYQGVQHLRKYNNNNNNSACCLFLLLLVTCLIYSFSLKMEALYSSETSVDFHQTSWCHVPKDNTIQSLYSVVIDVRTKRKLNHRLHSYWHMDGGSQCGKYPTKHQTSCFLLLSVRYFVIPSF